MSVPSESLFEEKELTHPPFRTVCSRTRMEHQSLSQLSVMGVLANVFLVLYESRSRKKNTRMSQVVKNDTKMIKYHAESTSSIKSNDHEEQLQRQHQASQQSREDILAIKNFHRQWVLSEWPERSLAIVFCQVWPNLFFGQHQLWPLQVWPNQNTIF